MRLVPQTHGPFSEVFSHDKDHVQPLEGESLLLESDQSGEANRGKAEVV